MRILAIETSCDETGIALLEGSKQGDSYVFKIIKNALLSQAKLHAEYGGVYPNLAKREHKKNLPALFEQFKDDEFDAIAVTQGPGLEPALWEGIVFAQELAKEKNLPLIPVNHMEGHLISSLVQHTNILENVRMSVLALLISGGHTEFILMREWFTYELIGETLDDAVGEAFDKVARMLDLPYPGGPEISKIAQTHRAQKQYVTASPSGMSHAAFVRLPRPMIGSNTCDVSFSGLKTAALYALKDKKLSQDERAAFAAEFEDAVADVFVTKTRKALIDTGAQTFVIGGGVAANRYLRERLQQLLLEEFPDVEFRLPELSITGDNAIMIAEAALTRKLAGLDDSSPDFRAVGNLALGQKVL